MSHRLAQPEEVELAFRALEEEYETTETVSASESSLKRLTAKFEGCSNLLAYTPTINHEHV